MPNFFLEQNLLFSGQSVDENKLPKDKSIKITNYVVHFFSPHLIAGEKKARCKTYSVALESELYATFLETIQLKKIDKNHVIGCNCVIKKPKYF